jgi:hypothetical protein
MMLCCLVDEYQSCRGVYASIFKVEVHSSETSLVIYHISRGYDADHKRLYYILAMLYQIQPLFSICRCTVDYEMGGILWKVVIASLNVFGGTEKILARLRMAGAHPGLP